MTENKEYVKHIIMCKCILPQFEHMQNPPTHRFIVFSELDANAEVVPSFAQCSNCGIVHKVIEVGKSQILKKETSTILPTIKEIKLSLPKELVELLEQYNLELYSWQEVQWIFDNESWGRTVVLTKEEIDGICNGKYIQFFGRNNWRINKFTREESVVSYDD